MTFSPLFNGNGIATTEITEMVYSLTSSFSPLFNGNGIATTDRGTETAAGGDLSVPYLTGMVLLPVTHALLRPRIQLSVPYLTGMVLLRPQDDS